MSFHHRTSKFFALQEALNFRLQSSRLSGDNYLLSDRRMTGETVEGFKLLREGAFNVPSTKSKSNRTKETMTMGSFDNRDERLDGNGSTSLFFHSHNSSNGSNVKQFFRSMIRKRTKDRSELPTEIKIVKNPTSSSVPVGFVPIELGKSYEAQGKDSIALLYFDKALYRQRKKFGDENLLTVQCLLYRGRILHKLGYTSKALNDMKKAASIQLTCISDETIEGDDKVEAVFLYTDILIQLGRLQIKQNKSEAYTNLYTALSFRQKYLGENHLDVALTWYIIARAYHQSKDYNLALMTYSQSLRIYEIANVPKTYQPVLEIRRHIMDKSMFHRQYLEHWEDKNAV